MNEPFHRLPDEITVPLAELRGVVVELDDLLDEFRTVGATAEQAARFDEAIGRMTRWASPLLRELDEEDGYDESRGGDGERSRSCAPPWYDDRGGVRARFSEGAQIR